MTIFTNFKLFLFSFLLLISTHWVQAQCEANAGIDTTICGFQHQLIGSPPGGNWNFLCDLSDHGIDFEDLNTGEANAEVGQCGTYYFSYTVTDGSCTASDTLLLNFDDPATNLYYSELNLSLEYNNYDCASAPPPICGNVAVITGLTPPQAIWEICGNGSCAHQSYTLSADTISLCSIDNIQIDTINSLLSSTESCWTGNQDELVVIIDGEIVDNSILDTIGGVQLDIFSSLYGVCPPVSSCIPIPEVCLDTIVDTVYIEIPIRLGGQWAYLQGDSTLLLDDTTQLNYPNQEYVFIVDPSSDYYGPDSLIFTVWEVENGTLNQLEDPFSITLEWQEFWTFDTLVRYDTRIEVSDSCAITACGGNSYFITGGDIPGIPSFDCPSLTLNFNPPLQGELTEVCNENQISYTVMIDLSGGVPPYSVTGQSGSILGNIFTSDPIPIDQSYSLVIEDAETSCPSIEFVGGPRCDCMPPPDFYGPNVLCPFEPFTLFAEAPDQISTLIYPPNDPPVTGPSASFPGLAPGVYEFIAESIYGGCSQSINLIIIVEDDNIQGDFLYDATIYCTNSPNPVPIINPDNAQGYSFFASNGLAINSGTGEIDLSQSIPGEYTVTADFYNDCNQISTNVSITIDEVQVTADNSGSITCIDTCVQLLGAGSAFLGAVDYEWYDSNGNFLSSDLSPIVCTPGEYTLVVTSQTSGCSTTAITMVEQEQMPPLIEIENPNLIVCSDATDISLGTNITVSGGLDFSYQWSGLGISPDQVNEIQPIVNTEGIYNLEVTNLSTGCVSSEEISMAYGAPLALEYQTEPTCWEENNGSLSLTSVTGGSGVYQFSLDNENFQSTPVFTDLSTGIYTIYVQDEQACEVTMPLEITSLAPLALNLVDEWHICGSETIQIDATLNEIANGELTYEWSNGQNSSILTTNEAGSYQVSISNTCETITQEITIIDDFEEALGQVYIPNAFSPDGDDVNDTFGPQMVNGEISNFEFQVFDRWGNSVYQSKQADGKWDGNKEGKILSSDVYVWWVRFIVTSCEGKPMEIFRSGDVTLLR